MKIASFIPAEYRRIIYLVLATLIGLEQVWDIMPSVLEGKFLATLAVLGFGMSAANTKVD